MQLLPTGLLILRMTRKTQILRKDLKKVGGVELCPAGSQTPGLASHVSREGGQQPRKKGCLVLGKPNWSPASVKSGGWVIAENFALKVQPGLT